MAEALLVLHLPGEGPRRVELHSGAYRLGRDSDCEICLPHPTVSRQHGLLERRGRHWLLLDNGSTNGLWWNGRRVKELLLNEGDTVRFGPEHLAGLPELQFHCRELTRLERLARLSSLGLAAVAAIGLATAVVQGGLVGRIARRLGDGRTVVIGILTTAVGYCGYGLVDSPVLFYGCIVIHALGGISGPALQSVVSNNVGPDEQGAVQGALASVQSLTFIVSPLLGAELFARFTAEGASVHVPGMPFYVATAALLVAALLATRSLRRTRVSVVPTTSPAPSLQQEQAP